MSYTREFDKLIGRHRLSEWKLESADPVSKAFDALLVRHLAFDLKMNKKDGYVPSKGVLAQREFHRQADQIGELGRSVRGDFWQEWAGKDKIQVGFRDNRDKAKYAAATDKLSDVLSAEGYKVSVHPSGTMVLLDKNLASKIDAKRPEWLKAMENQGGHVTEGKLTEDGTPDETFAAAFAQHREAEGSPLSLADWEATMRLALEKNLEPDETDYKYNKFDLAKVSAALTPFSNLTFTPGREFGPVLFVGGPSETLATLAKVAEKKLGAQEAKMVSKSQLRVAWT